MRRAHLAAAAVAIAVAAAAWAQEPTAAQAPAAAPAIAIRDVTVVDGTDAPPQPHRTVLLQAGRIAAIGGAELAIPEGATTIDGAGKWLVPGLWDMHVHMTALPGFAEMFVANGVIGVRDMFAIPSQIASVAKAIADGERTGPRIVCAGRIVDGEQPIWPGSIEAKDAASGTAAVATAIDEGSAFVKVYSKLSRDAYFAIAKACKERGAVFAGHVPRSVTAEEAATAGQRSIEHLTGVLEACCTDPLRAADQSVPRIDRQRLVATSYQPEKATALAKVFEAHGTWMCPTFTVLRAVAFLDDTKFTADDRTRYLSPFFVQMWLPKNDKRFASMTADDWKVQKDVYARQLEAGRALHNGGARFLAGTDTGNPYCFPGFSLHDELELLVSIGLSPQQALQSATRDAAEYLGLEKELGTIAVGLRASVLLLAADPLAAIANTRRIDAVVLDGRLLDRAALDHLLPAVDTK